MRNNCRHCRYLKCLHVGMSREAIKMGRPKKGDSTLWCSSKPSAASSPANRRALKQLTNSTLLSDGSREGSAEALLEGALEDQGVENELVNKLTLEAVFDSSFIADEFLEAVSMGMDQNEPNVKTEPVAVSSNPSMAEQIQVTSTLTLSPCSAASPPDHGLSSSRSENSTSTPMPFSLMSGDSCVLPICAEPVPSAGFAMTQVHGSVPQSQQLQILPEVSSLKSEEENMSSDDSTISYPEHREYYSPRENSLLSPPCYCNPCYCNSPISDCDSPSCPSDYRSQMHCLPSTFMTSQLLASSLPPVSAGMHNWPTGFGKTSCLAHHLKPDQFGAPHHAFVPSVSQHVSTPQVKEDGQISVIHRHVAHHVCFPSEGHCSFCSSLGEKGIFSGSAHQLKNSGAQKPDGRLIDKLIEERLAMDDISSLMDSLKDRYPVPSSTVHTARLPMTPGPAACGRPDQNTTYISRMPHSQGLSFSKMLHERLDSHRRQSDSQLEFVPDCKVRKWSHHLSSIGDPKERSTSWTSPVAMNLRPDLPTERCSSTKFNRQPAFPWFSSFVPYEQQQFRESSTPMLTKSYSQGSLHHSNRDPRTSGIMPTGFPRVQHHAFLNTDWHDIEYSEHHYAAMANQGSKHYGMNRARQFHNQIVLSHVDVEQVARKTQTCIEHQPIKSTRCENTTALSSCIMDRSSNMNGNVDPITGVLGFFKDNSSVCNGLKPRAGLAALTTTSGNDTYSTITSSTVSSCMSKDLFQIQSTLTTSNTENTLVTFLESNKLTEAECKGKQPSLGDRFILSSGQCRQVPRQACPSTSLSFPVVSEGASSSLKPLPHSSSTTGEGVKACLTSSAITTTSSSDLLGSPSSNTTWDLQALEKVNRYFLTLDNSCKKNACGSSQHQPSLGEQNCPTCCQSEQQQEHGREGKTAQQGMCLRCWHHYWHGYHPSSHLVASRMDPEQQEFLDSLSSASFQLLDELRQLHKTEEQTTNMSQLLQRLHQQGTAITAMSRSFLLAVPGGDSILTEDADLLSEQFAFSTALIMLSAQPFHPEGRQFMEILTWTVGPTSPLFCFKVQLLAVATDIHTLAMDKTETALLCALSLCCTDTVGLKNKEAIQAVRSKLLASMEACLVSKDQSGFKERVRCLFSVLPDVRLITAWFYSILSNIKPPSVGVSPARLS